MNYQLHYNRLIERAKNRILNGYSEKHHIIPICMGGDNASTNIVRLIPEEHYLAHQILVKLNRGNLKISYAAIAMSGNNKNIKRTNKIFGWLRKEYSKALKVRMIGNQYGKGQIIKPHHMAILQLPKSEEHKQKISVGNLGKTKGISRGPQSEDHKLKRGKARAKAWEQWRINKSKGELSS